MAVVDPIADMFTRIRNGLQVQKEDVSIPYSNMKLGIAKILLAEGFIEGYEIVNEDILKRFIRCELKYRPNGDPVISHIEKISKSGKRLYISKKNVPKVLNGFGISIMSTSKGVMTGRDARINNVGGEFVGEVY